MSRWFRHYAGMMRDEKLVSAAIRSKQPVERVVWVWGAILESASEVNDGGRFDLDAGEAAYFLRVDESDIQSILAALVSLGRVSEGSVVRWSDRQFESDQSKDRQKRYRERLKASRDGGVTPGDGGVTAQETDTEADSSSLRSELFEKKRGDGFEKWFSSWPSMASDDIDASAKAFAALPQPDQVKAIASTPAYLKAATGGGRTMVVSSTKYLTKRLWERVDKARPVSQPALQAIAGKPQSREEYLAAELRRSQRSFQ